MFAENCFLHTDQHLTLYVFNFILQSTAAGSSSLSGKLVAAIVVAVLVFGIAGLVSCRYAYHRFINRPKFRFEDYGYSHLQMMQDSEDFYYKNSDDDDDHGLLDL
jgi:hypothetical protein